MKIALYKGRGRIFNKLISWWTRGPYSHCELIFSDGLSASSSFLDKGVRFKNINYAAHPENWDFIELDKSFDELFARQFFLDRVGLGYDVQGILGFVFRRVSHWKKKWFCDEIVLASLGIKDSWRFNPNDVPSFFSRNQQ